MKSMIRQMGEQDLPECLAVIHQSFQTVACEFGLTPDNCPTNGAFMPCSRLENDYRNGDLLYGFYEGIKIVGFMQLARKDDETYELEKLAVLPEFRHHGYGRAMIRFSKQKVQELHGSRIRIGIIEENERLKTWYESNGFIHTGTRVFPHLPFTVGFMELPINEPA